MQLVIKKIVVFIVYTLLEKGMKSTTLLWGILILGIVCSFFGIL